MSVDVLKIFQLAAVDIARKIKIVVVPGVADLGDRHEARIARDFKLAGEGVDNAMNVLLPQTILRAVFAEPFGSINHEDAFPSAGVLLIKDNDASWNSSSEEEIRRQTDDTFGVTALNKVAGNRGVN